MSEEASVKKDAEKSAKLSAREEESEFTRTKKNEKRLFDENKALKRQIANFIKNENAAKKTEIEYGKLQQKVKELDLLNNNLRNDLQQTKANYAKEKSEKIHLKSALETKNLNLESRNQDLQNKYSVEKSMRAQLEQQLEKFHNIKEEKDKLVAQNYTLNHKVEELSGYKQCTSKSVQELKQMVRQKDAENDKTNYELCELRTEVKHMHEAMAHVVKEKDKVEVALKKALQMRDQIKEYQKQIDIERTNNYKLNREVRHLTFALDEQRNKIVNTDHRADKALEACKEKDLQIECQQKESEKQRLLITKLSEQVDRYNDLKHRLKNEEAQDIAFSHVKDQMIINMRHEIKEMEDIIRHLRMEISSHKVTREQAFKNLVKAQLKIRQLEETTDSLTGEILSLESDAVSKKSETAKYERKYRHLKKQLQHLKIQLSQAKMKQEVCVTSADRDQALAKKTLAIVSAERDQLKKELGYTKDLLYTQQQRVNLHEAEKLKLKTEEKEIHQELKMVRLSMKDLEQNNKLLMTKMLQKPISRPATTGHMNIGLSKAKVDEACPPPTSPEEEEEKMELKRKLEQAEMKLHERRWDIRKLKRQNKALEGQLMAYVDSHSNYKQKTYELEDQLRNIKVDIWEKSKAKAVKQQAAPPEEKHTIGWPLRQRRIVLTSTKHKPESKDQSKTPLLPPIHGKSITLPGMSAQHPDPSEDKSAPHKLPHQPPHRISIVLPPLGI